MTLFNAFSMYSTYSAFAFLKSLRHCSSTRSSLAWLLCYLLRYTSNKMCWTTEQYHPRCGHWGTPLLKSCAFGELRSGCAFNQKSGVTRVNTLCIACGYRVSVNAKSMFTYRNAKGELMDFKRSATLRRSA